MLDAHSDYPYVTPSELKDLITNIVKMNAENPDDPVSLAIWGRPGTGKSAVVRAFEGATLDIKGEQVPCGFGEVRTQEAGEQGDIVGYPKEIDGVVHMLRYSFFPGEDHPGPGIILWDDINRGNPQILNTTMGIIQTNSSAYWKMGKGWTHIMTANPDDGTQDVCSLDSAKMTRMMHVKMAFSVQDWIFWATKAKIYGPLIAFAQHRSDEFYPEVKDKDITTHRTCPRTWSALGKLLAHMDPEEKGISVLGSAITKTASMAVDHTAAAAFAGFMTENSEYLIPPQNLLSNLKDSVKVLKKAHKEGYSALIYVTYFRLANYICTPNFIKTQSRGIVDAAKLAVIEGMHIGLRTDQVRAIVDMLSKHNSALAVEFAKDEEVRKCLTV